MLETVSKNIFTGGIDENMPTIEVETGRKLIEVLVEAKIFASKGEVRRMIQQNGLTLNDEKVTDIEKILDKLPAIVKVGKKKFYRLVEN